MVQLHYTGWPDHDVPSGKAMEEFGKTIDYFIDWTLKSKNEEKAVVHCSAGIGRTGTTIAIVNLAVKIMSQLANGTRIEDAKFSIFSTVR